MPDDCVTCVCVDCNEPASNLMLFCDRHRSALPKELFLAIERRCEVDPNTKHPPQVQLLIRKAIMHVAGKERGLNKKGRRI